MLPAHAHHVFAPLAGVKQQFEREARLGAESVRCLELFDFGLSPGMETLASPLEAFHAERRVAFDHFDESADRRMDTSRNIPATSNIPPTIA